MVIGMNPTPTSTPRSFHLRRRAFVLAAVLAGAAAVPSAADAASVTVSPEYPAYAATAIGVTDYDGHDDDIRVTYDDDGTANPADDRLVIRNETGLLTYDSQQGVPMQDKHCVEVVAHEVRCRIIGVEDATVFLGGGDDRVQFFGNSPLGNN